MTYRSNVAEVEHHGGDASLVDALTDEVENDSAPVVDLLMQAPSIAEGAVRLDELGVRRLLRRLAYLAREGDTLKAMKRTIAAKYDEAIGKRDAEAAEIKALLTTHLHLVDGNKVKVPDVGTAFLGKRQPKLEVTDREAFEAWARERFGAKVVREVFDEAAARAEALGQLLNKGDGEVPAGAELVPERREVTVRPS